MSKDQYILYLQSEHWQETKERLKKDRCEVCGSQTNLDLHHLSYAFYRETDHHLATLCRECHYASHLDTEGNRLPAPNPWVKMLIWKLRADPYGCEAQFLRSRLRSQYIFNSHEATT